MSVSIHQVVANLKTTIAGKEAYLASHTKYLESAGTSGPENMAIYATAKFLEVNINELKVILHDVEQCAEQFSLMSWEINPERMGQ
jgi:hypothetical protein